MFEFKLDWNKDLELGIDKIDEQHKQLLVIGRKIEQYIITKCENITVNEINSFISELRNYATYHYYYEEKLMQLGNYSKTEQHIKEHKKAIQFINEIDPEIIKNNPLEEAKELKSWIQSYVFEHIIGSDIDILEEFGRERIIELAQLL